MDKVPNFDEARRSENIEGEDRDKVRDAKKMDFSSGPDDMRKSKNIEGEDRDPPRGPKEIDF